MPSALVEVEIVKGGPTILVESRVSEGSPAFVDAANDSGVIMRAEKTLSEALSHLAPFLNTVLNTLQSAVHLPKTVDVELGIKFGAKGNVIVAGGSAEANCKVTVSWELPVDKQRPSGI
jgi:hypothetical protein